MTEAATSWLPDSRAAAVTELAALREELANLRCRELELLMVIAVAEAAGGQVVAIEAIRQVLVPDGVGETVG